MSRVIKNNTNPNDVIHETQNNVLKTLYTSLAVLCKVSIFHNW